MLLPLALAARLTLKAMSDETTDSQADALGFDDETAQLALAAVPWLEQLTGGQWSGELHYHRAPAEAAWSGRLALTDATIAIPGLADSVQLNSAHAQIDGGEACGFAHGMPGGQHFGVHHQTAFGKHAQVRFTLPEQNTFELIHI